jgi:hypothetical protein
LKSGKMMIEKKKQINLVCINYRSRRKIRKAIKPTTIKPIRKL